MIAAFMLSVKLINKLKSIIKTKFLSIKHKLSALLLKTKHNIARVSQKFCNILVM